MTFLSAILTGLSSTFRAKRLWLFLYVSLLIIALLLAFPFNNFLGMAFGHSLELDRHLGEFDYTLMADLSNNFGDGLSMIIYHARWIILIYLIASVFFAGGIVGHFYREKSRFQFSDFLNDASHFFWRYLRLTIYFLFFYAIVLAIGFQLFQIITGGLSPFDILDDSKITPAFYWATGLALFLGILVNSIHQLAKFEIAKQDHQYIFKAISAAAKTVFRHLFAFLFFYLILLLLFALWFYINKWVQQAINPSGNLGIYLTLIAGQIFVLLRVALQLIKYGGIHFLHRRFLVQS